MARIVGVDLPKNKKIEYALPYIFGIGLTLSRKILKRANVQFETRVKDLTEDEIIRLREIVREFVVEGDLKREIQQDVKRLMDTGSYRGRRHKMKLPCRGQRTHTNARTKKGKRIAIAGKKKVTK